MSATTDAIRAREQANREAVQAAKQPKKAKRVKSQPKPEVTDE